eukprot:3032183-Prymnesium_polylepis.1
MGALCYINGALWWALQFETGARAHSLRDETKTQTSVTPAGRCGGPLKFETSACSLPPAKTEQNAHVGYTNGAMERYVTVMVRNRRGCSRCPAKRNETHTSVTPAGQWNVT